MAPSRRRRVDGVARGAESTSSAKRAKVDEAKEDPLVRRKEEVVRFLASAKGKGKVDARAKKELLTLCADFEAKNEKLLGRLPAELWHKIVDENVQQNDLFALAMTCRFFREKQKVLGKKVETDLYTRRFLGLWKSGKVASHSLGWFRWVCDTFEILPDFKDRFGVKGAMYEGVLLNYAAFQGSVEILRWLMEEKGWGTNPETDWWAGMSGSIEVLEHLSGKGYEFGEHACTGAAWGGHLEALKCLRGLDPPCPWDGRTCEMAAEEGHLDVLKWLRSQDPPCPWYEWTCEVAARGGNLEVLEWARSQDPPCPWSRRACREVASRHGRQHVVKWIDQQEDVSDVDY